MVLTVVVALVAGPTYLGFRVNKGEQELVAVRGNDVYVLYRPKPGPGTEHADGRCGWFEVSPSERYILSSEWVFFADHQGPGWVVRRLSPGAPRVAVLPAPDGDVTFAPAWGPGDRVRYCTFAHAKHPVAGRPFIVGRDVWELAAPFRTPKLLGHAADEAAASLKLYGRKWLTQSRLTPKSAGPRTAVGARSAFVYYWANEAIPDPIAHATVYQDPAGIWLYHWGAVRARRVWSGIGVTAGWLRSAGRGKASWTVQQRVQGSAWESDGNVTDAYRPGAAPQSYTTFIIDMRTGAVSAISGLAAAVELGGTPVWLRPALRDSAEVRRRSIRGDESPSPTGRRYRP